MSTRKRWGGAPGGITRTRAALRLLLVVSSCALFLFAGPRPAFSSPPANDNFADADVISTLPFTDSGDLNGTTTEPGEQQFCSYQPQTVWYTFTPSSTTVISADLNGSQGGVVLSAYQSNGGGIGGLGFMSCIFYGSLTFTANAGTTYYFQVGSYYSGSFFIRYPGPATFHWRAAAYRCAVQKPEGALDWARHHGRTSFRHRHRSA